MPGPAGALSRGISEKQREAKRAAAEEARASLAAVSARIAELWEELTLHWPGRHGRSGAQGAPRLRAHQLLNYKTIIICYIRARTSEQAREARVTGERQQEQRGHTTGGGGGGGGALPSWRSEATLSQTDRPGAPPHRHSPFLQPLSYTPPRLRPPAKYPQLRIVPRRHTRTAPPRCVCNACARLLVRF